MSDGASPIEGENFTRPASGTTIVSDPMYSGGKALRLDNDDAIATKQVTFTSDSVVIIRARAGQTGGSPSLHLQVGGSNVQTRQIDSDPLDNYHFNNYVFLANTTYTIGLKGKNIATGRKVHVDLVTFPVSSSQDLTPPETTIDSGPDGVVGSSPDPFTFSSSEPGSTFECSMDGEAFSACVSPQYYSDLTEDQHTFQVRAIDAAGNVDPTPASRTFTVYVTPEVHLDSPQLGTVLPPVATNFELSANKYVEFLCNFRVYQIGPDPALSPCGSGTSTTLTIDLSGYQGQTVQLFYGGTDNAGTTTYTQAVFTVGTAP